MKNNTRLDQIVELIKDHGFLSVKDLSRFCDVSEMTIRRDLEQLDAQKRIQRTYGGAATLPAEPVQVEKNGGSDQTESKPDVLRVDQMDVLVATSVNPYYDSLLVDRAVKKKKIPIIAESSEMPNQLTLVAVDNYQAGRDLGLWAGQYLSQQGVQKANLLDLTFHQPNTQDRSRGFVDGLHETFPSSEVVLSINSQSRFITSYQLTRDALSVYPHINLIFAINDITARGAINACRDLGLDSQRMTIITFGLEGDTLKNELMAGGYCKAGLAMFPEIVSLTCIKAAIAAYNQQPLPEHFVTPHIVLTKKSLTDYYTQTASGWQLNWETVHRHLKVPLETEMDTPGSVTHLPSQIGLIVPFVEHEWYKNLTQMIKTYAEQYGIGFQNIDAEQSVRDEVELRRRQIAAKAATLVKPGNVVLIDCGPIAKYLAEELKKVGEITVITNSITVFDALNRTPGITLISTGGAARFSSQVLVGPTAEGALKELRADKLFLSVSGISLNFGLSHHTISEVTIKQAMIRSAAEVILLADHASFGAETGIQVAPITVVHKLITDDALPPSVRLDISKVGIQILLG